MKKISLILSIIFLTSSIYYLISPSPSFPPPSPGSLQSAEPGDTETIYRRAYYTNLTRQEIMEYYDKNFPDLIQYRLRLPPEDSQTLIRDQTKSSFLEQIVHPWKSSLYINAFVPTKPTEQININKVHYLNKVTLRLVPSHPIPRLTVLFLTAIGFYWLTREYSHV